MLRALHALPRERRPGRRGQLRPGRLPRRRSPAAELEHGARARLRRRLRGRRCCRRSRSRSASCARRAVNDAVVVSGVPGRIVELAYALDGEELGTQPCDGLICATPPGSTAYNLSNGGPVLVWGLDAAVITFVAPHTLHARPLVVGPGFELAARNLTPDVEAVVLIDGHPVGVARARARRSASRFGRGAQPARDAARAGVLRPLPARLRQPAADARRRAPRPQRATVLAGGRAS